MYKIILFIILIFGQQLFSQADFTIIGLPDTQYYVSSLNGGTPSMFENQTNWILENKDSLNIVYVAHLGDCVEHANIDLEWQLASTYMSYLEDPVTTNLTSGLPYGIAVGNHDSYPTSEPTQTQKYNEYFGESRFSDRNYYGDHYGSDNDNHYDFFSVSGMDFIVIYIEYDTGQQPSDSVIIWAQGLLQSYGTRRAIIVSHYILNGSGSFGDQGQVLYDAFKSYSNVFLMLCGHKYDEAQKTDIYNENTIYSLLSDYQFGTNGGNGYLRIMEFSPSAGTISVKTYSPTTGNFKTGSSSQFTLNYDFSPLPVELAFFTGSLNGNYIDLRWRTETEVNNFGFYIERSTENSDWSARGFVEGHGNSNSPNQYTFNDSNIEQSGNYHYRLKQIDNDGTFEYSDVVTVTIGVPVLYSLSQNYPNPFNPEARIDYTLPEQQNVLLRVYNMLGEMVKELVNEVKPAGTFTATFNGSDLPSGIYVYRIQTERFAENKKMTLLK